MVTSFKLALTVQIMYGDTARMCSNSIRPQYQSYWNSVSNIVCVEKDLMRYIASEVRASHFMSARLQQIKSAVYKVTLHRWSCWNSYSSASVLNKDRLLHVSYMMNLHTLSIC